MARGGPTTTNRFQVLNDADGKQQGDSDREDSDEGFRDARENDEDTQANLTGKKDGFTLVDQN